MLAGVKTHWKQVIAYHLTGDSIKSGCLKGIIFELIRKVEGIGFCVHSIISDCEGNYFSLTLDQFTLIHYM